MAEFPNPADPRNWPTPDWIKSYIYAGSVSRNLNPEKTLYIAGKESVNFTDFVGDNGLSGGPFQLFTGGGLGNEFQQKYGVSPLDPRSVAQQIDFSLDKLAAGQYFHWTTARAANTGGLGDIDPRTGGSIPGVSLPTSPGKAPGVAVTTGTPDYIFPVQDYGGSIQLHHGSDPGASDLFAPAGTNVFAMHGGTITGMGTGDSLGGNWWMIRGFDGLDYYYAHLQDMAGLKIGDHVDTGQTLGTVGNTGNASNTAPHLHIGIGKGINDGAGAKGGSGKDFDAVGLLRGVLDGVGSAWTDPMGAVSGAAQAGGKVLEVANSILSMNPGALMSLFTDAIRLTVLNMYRTVVNWFEDRQAALLFLGIGAILIVAGLVGFLSTQGEKVAKVVVPTVAKAVI